MMISPAHARRLRFAAVVIILIALGLASRRYLPVSTFFIGSALWAMMLYYLVAAVLVSASSKATAGVTAVLCVFVEVVHLFSSPVVESVARHSFGKLVIGQGFSFSDLFWYAVGIGAAAAGRRRIERA